MSSAWDQLQQLLTCAICLDKFRNPKLLPCHHSFCYEPCMDGLQDYARRQIKCPVCRAEHRIPFNGIQSYPTNVTLMQFLELHQSITGEEPDPIPSMMERCGVCSEKSTVMKCSHCEKKVCTECKEAHLDILKREISRIVSQIRRALNRLQESLIQTEKNCDRLATNQIQVRDEIEEIVRRFIKDIKNKEDKLIRELEQYSQAESKNLNKLREDLEIEYDNMLNNCDIAEKNVLEGDKNWTDIELVEYKDIFLRTLDFLRTFDPDSSDYSKRIKFIHLHDLDDLRRNLANFGELKLPQEENRSNSPQPSTLNVPVNNVLMRSQSDHRLATQFARRESRIADIMGRTPGGLSDSERDPRERASSPTYGAKSRSLRYGIDREDRSDLNRRYGLREDTYKPSWSTRGIDEEGYQFKSRFMRERGMEMGFDDHEYDSISSHRSVRFEEPAAAPPIVKVFDTIEAPRGPLSGIVKLSETAHFMERLHENEARAKVEKEAKEQEPHPPVNPPVQVRKPPSRQVSEDEIEKQKKMNKMAPAASTNSQAVTAPVNVKSAVPDSPTNRFLPRRVSSLRDDEERSNGSRRNSDATSKREEVNEEEEVDLENRRRRRSLTIDENKDRATASARQVNENDLPPKDDTSSTELVRRNSKTLSKSRALLSRQTSIERESDDTAIDNYCPRSLYVTRRSLDYHDKPLTHGYSSLLRSRSPSMERDVTKTEISRPSLSRTSSLEEQGRYSRYSRTNSRLSRSSTVSSLASSSSRFDEDYRSSRSRPSSPTRYTSYSSISSARRTYTSIGDSRLTETRQSSNTNRFRSDLDNDQEGTKQGINSECSLSSSSSESDSDEDIINIVQSIRNSARNRSKISTSANTTSKTGKSFLPGSVAELLNRSAQVRRDSIELRARIDCKEAHKSKYGAKKEEYNNRKIEPHSTRYGKLTTNYTNWDEDVKAQPKSKANYLPDYSNGSNASQRRRHLSRSKSSHSLGGQEESDEEPQVPTFRSKYAAENYGRSRYQYRTREREKERSPVQETAGSSAWSQYLRSKYGSSRTSSVGSSGSGAKPLAKSKSSHAVYTRAASESSDDEPAENYSRRGSRDTDDNKRAQTTGHNYGFPRSMYMQKRRMAFKIGTRGTDPSCFTWPRGVAVTPDNSIVVADSSNHRVQVFDSTGKFTFEFGSYGTGEGEFDCLAGVSVNRIGQFIISDRYNHRIQIFDPSGRFLRAFGSEGRSDGKLSYPWGITSDSLGFIYVCDKENHRIQVFQSEGTFVGKFGSIGSRPGLLEHPHYIAVSNTNRVIVSDTNNHRIQIFDVNGRSLSTFGSEGSDEGNFKFPRGVAVDDQGYIIVGDSGNNRIQIFNPDGTFLKAFGNWGSNEGEFKGLEGVAVTATGNILVCDRENHRIQVF